MVCRRSVSRSFSSRCSHSMWDSMLGRTATVVAVFRRSDQHNNQLRLRATSIEQLVSASLRGRTGGRTASPKWASTAASRVSVLASFPGGPGKVAHLAWVDDDNRQRLDRQGLPQGAVPSLRWPPAPRCQVPGSFRRDTSCRIAGSSFEIAPPFLPWDGPRCPSRPWLHRCLHSSFAVP